jgi:hypothetical protein
MLDRVWDVTAPRLWAIYAGVLPGLERIEAATQKRGTGELK